MAPPRARPPRGNLEPRLLDPSDVTEFVRNAVCTHVALLPHQTVQQETDQRTQPVPLRSGLSGPFRLPSLSMANKQSRRSLITLSRGDRDWDWYPSLGHIVISIDPSGGGDLSDEVFGPDCHCLSPIGC